MGLDENKMKKLLVFIPLFFLVACEKTITVEQFKADEQLLNTYLSRCENGELHREDINCLNSRKTKNKIILEAEEKLLMGK